MELITIVGADEISATARCDQLIDSWAGDTEIVVEGDSYDIGRFDVTRGQDIKGGGSGRAYLPDDKVYIIVLRLLDPTDSEDD